MELLVYKSVIFPVATFVESEFGIQEFVFYACGSRILIDAFLCRLVE